MNGPSPDVTDLLLLWSAGDRRALEALTPVIYDDLRHMAGAFLSRERPEHTLSATALVHEVYLRLVDQRRVRWENRAHFFGAAATIMRRILVDHARTRAAGKRGGAIVKVAMEEGMALVDGLADEVLDLDAALDALTALDDRKAQIVQMKFFAGMTNQETAEALGVSDATVERDWTLARAWLIAHMHAAT
ncbi:MAG: sigma-70 family RNA polymerase sigma factor [Acidobacteria bacterium]|nr:sigma-70 family RNA polymerase sigma factor [Acidobacteriota bacterium]